MVDETDDSLSRIVSGSGIIFAGSVIHKLIAFFGSIFIARLLGDSNYGAFVISLSVFFILGTISNLGLGTGLARNYPRTDSNRERRGFLVSAYQISLVSSLAGAVVVFTFADILAIQVFDDSSITPVVRVMALIIPLQTLQTVSLGGLQAIRKPVAKTVITSVFQPLVRIVFIIALVLAGYGAVGVAGAYAVATGSAGILTLYVVYKNTNLFSFGIPTESVYRRLLTFSLPLVGSSVIMTLMNNIDTVLVGTFGISADVGQYNVAFVLGQTTLLFYQTLGFMYVPELSELHDEGKMNRASLIYRAVTKWVFLVSTPFILTAVVFPDTVITFIYSSTYKQATIPFLILTGGFLTHILVGPNINTLTSFGDTRQILAFDTATVFVNILLNIVLIPRFGISGAAVATSISYVIRNTGMTVYLYRRYDILPFSQWLFLPLAPPLLVASALFAFVSNPSILLVIASSVVLLAATAIGYLSSGIEEADVILSEVFRDRTGVDIKWIRWAHERLR